MRILRSSFATTNSAPLSWPLRPIFHASATRIEYAFDRLGCASTAPSARRAGCRCAAPSRRASPRAPSSRRPTACCVRSVTRAVSGGIGASPSDVDSHAGCANARQPAAASATIATQAAEYREHVHRLHVGDVHEGRRAIAQRRPRTGSRRCASADVDQDFGAGGGRRRGVVGAGAAPGAGTAGALPKSTFGGALTAPSSATVKLGFTFILKIIAVRFVGN